MFLMIFPWSYFTPQAFDRPVLRRHNSFYLLVGNEKVGQSCLIMLALSCVYFWNVSTTHDLGT